MEPNYPDRGLSRKNIIFGFTRVYRDFESDHQMNNGLIVNQRYYGTITQVYNLGEGKNRCEIFLITYSDGDKEELKWPDLKRLLAKQIQQPYELNFDRYLVCGLAGKGCDFPRPGEQIISIDGHTEIREMKMLLTGAIVSAPKVVAVKTKRKIEKVYNWRDSLSKSEREFHDILPDLP